MALAQGHLLLRLDVVDGLLEVRLGGELGRMMLGARVDHVLLGNSLLGPSGYITIVLLLRSVVL